MQEVIQLEEDFKDALTEETIEHLYAQERAQRSEPTWTLTWMGHKVDDKNVRVQHVQI